MKNNKIKICLKILLCLFIFILVSFVIIFIVHKFRCNNEYNELKKQGYINKYSAGNYNLNIYRVGNKNSKHKLIGISGLGVNNYSIEMSFVNEKLKDDYELIYIDRAGYGYSDDTSKKQTVEQIVSDYRIALKNAGIDGPYILMPHSIGGVYATYWESLYPTEIEGVIFIDGTEMGLNVLNKEDFSLTFDDYLGLYACNLGFSRFKIARYLEPLPSHYTKEHQKYSDYLNIKACMNRANLSEIKEKNNNINIAYKNIKNNNIPKKYISSEKGARTIEEFKDVLNWITKRKKELGIKTITKMPTDEQIEKIIEQHIKWENEKINPYIDLLGNTEIVLLPGDHYIFEQKPEELANIIKNFVENID